jgi:hypothetical protein
MIFVTGTKRSGTSMWMQILKAAGIPVIGEAFPSRWRQTIEDANPEGFYESRFRQGVFHATNPDPKTGKFISPRTSRGHAVKVFAPGVVRSDLAYVERVLVTVRPFREYMRSIDRLLRMEHASKERLDGVAKPFPTYMPAVLEWWRHNYILVRDVLVREHPAHFVAYDAVLEQPDATIREVITWLGVGDAEAAIKATRPELRTQTASAEIELPEYVTEEHVAVFDGWYERVRMRRGIDAAFIDRMNAVHETLLPHIEKALAEVAAAERATGRSETAEDQD